MAALVYHPIFLFVGALKELISFAKAILDSVPTANTAQICEFVNSTGLRASYDAWDNAGLGSRAAF